jgi:hypothetical protein
MLSVASNELTAVMDERPVVQVPTARFIDNILPWQYETMRAFDEGRARFIMGELHRRARKTTMGLNLLIREWSTHPGASYFYMGPTYKQAKKTVWLDPNMLFACLPERSDYAWEKNESELYVRSAQGAMLHILGGDDPDSLRGPDWRGGVLDEWSLMKENIFTEILYPVISQDTWRWLAFFYTTKGMNHAAMMFDKYGGIQSPLDLPASGATSNPEPEWYCTRLDAEVSGIIPAAELAKAKQRMPVWLYDQEYRCARVTQEERALITSVLMEALEAVYKPATETKKIISCDPAEGNDEIVCQAFENTEVEEQKILHRAGIGDNLMILSGHLKNMGMDHECNNFIIDGIGIGKGVADDLRLDKAKNVIVFKGNEKASESERFADKNMEALWYVYRRMQKGEVEPIEDRETKRQLPMLRCQANRSGQLALDNRDKIRKECGCSPDRAKCYLMGIYGLQFVESEEHKRRKDGRVDGWKKKKKKRSAWAA